MLTYQASSCHRNLPASWACRGCWTGETHRRPAGPASLQWPQHAAGASDTTAAGRLGSGPRGSKRETPWTRQWQRYSVRPHWDPLAETQTGRGERAGSPPCKGNQGKQWSDGSRANRAKGAFSHSAGTAKLAEIIPELKQYALSTRRALAGMIEPVSFCNQLKNMSSHILDHKLQAENNGQTAWLSLDNAMPRYTNVINLRGLHNRM